MFMPRRFSFWAPLAAIFIGFLVYLYMRPVPVIKPVNDIISVPKTQPAALVWPANGQSAIGAKDYGVLASHNSQAPTVIGSTAKIITAMAVLEKKPLSPGEQGPSITITQPDVDSFNYYYQQNGSVTPVKAGETVSELQALQMLLLPSSNNMADTLARWAFGSTDSYLNYANNMTKRLGMKNTKVADTNGFFDTTTSSAEDLVKIGLEAIKNPALDNVVSQRSADVPVAGTINNVNILLGQDGVFGIKTGHTDKAGGCYLFAAKRQVLGHEITEVGALLNADSLSSALNSAPPLITSADKAFQNVTVIHKGQVLGSYNAPWGNSSDIISAKDIALPVFKGMPIIITGHPHGVSAIVKKGSQVGTVTAKSGQLAVSAPLVTNKDIPKPGIRWRIVR
jgi:D-alanyl-D-alanine carboxypeptidase (penicillin-binding protein 5/6)